MRVLLTGMTGLVGGAIGRRLLATGHEVIGLARHPPAWTADRLRWVGGDLLDDQAVAQSVRGLRWDAVVHAAALMPSRRSGPRDFFDNVRMTRNLLAALERPGAGYVLLVSSVDVYAVTAETGPITEQTAVAPDTFYGASKLLSEEWLRTWSRAGHGTAGILRLGHLFGPQDRGTKFIPEALRCLKIGEPITLYGDGDDERDYLFVADAAALVVRGVEQGVTGTCNLATGESRSLLAVLDTLTGITGNRPRVEFKPRAKRRVDYRFNVVQMHSLLGPVALTPFAAALRLTYEAA